MSPRWTGGRRRLIPQLSRLYEAIENGLVEMGDSSLKARIAELTTIRDQARGDAERAVAHIERIGPEITVRAFTHSRWRPSRSSATTMAPMRGIIFERWRSGLCSVARRMRESAAHAT